MGNIAVIGAGIAGTTTAYALLKKGHKVTIFDSSVRSTHLKDVLCI